MIPLPQPTGHSQAPLWLQLPPLVQLSVGSWQLKHTGHSGHCLFASCCLDVMSCGQRPGTKFPAHKSIYVNSAPDRYLSIMYLQLYCQAKYRLLLVNKKKSIHRYPSRLQCALPLHHRGQLLRRPCLLAPQQRRPMDHGRRPSSTGCL